MGNKNSAVNVQNKSKIKITVLGSGTSTGIPTLGCKCSVCTSKIQKNKRLRSSIIITINNKRILIDASTDLRTQLLDNNIDDIDGCIITHEHADHTHGIDDLRPFCFKKEKPIPVFASEVTSKILTNKFSYIFQRHILFKDKKVLGGGIPKLDLNEVSPGSNLILGEEFTFFSLPHGHHETLGFRVGKFAYIIDCNEVSDDIIDSLKDEQLELLIIDCLRIKKHQTHLHLDLALEYAKRIGATKTGLTHMSHDFEHEDFSQMLCKNYGDSIFPLYDTQQFELFY
jgi:phosphoribosyl 1,2-cyclic phosphate phosphodiesterase